MLSKQKTNQKKPIQGIAFITPGWQFIFSQYLSWQGPTKNNILPKPLLLQKIKIFYWQNKFFLYIYGIKETMKFNSAYFYGYYFYFNSKSRD